MHITTIISLMSTLFILTAVVSLVALKKYLWWAPAAVAITQLGLLILEIITGKPFGHTTVNLILWSSMWNIERRVNQYRRNEKTFRMPKGLARRS